jgi:hypothetical protein
MLPHRKIWFLFGLIALGFSSAAAAQDCPTAVTAKPGFTVERSGTTDEIAFADDRLVHSILRFAGGSETLLETTAFEGLFDLERIDRGRRSVFHPVTNLASLFPLRVGKTLTANFNLGDPPQAVKATTVMRLKGKDSFFIGSCKYAVFVIDKSIGRGGGTPVFVETDYYAPDLKTVIAKQFKNADGSTLLTKFDRIYPIKH